MLTVLAAMLLSTGCADFVASQTRRVDPGAVSLQSLLDPDALAIPGTDPGDVVDALGEPLEVATRKPRRKLRPGKVSVMRYDDLEIIVVQLDDPSRAYISELVITGRGYATGLPVGVGSDRGEIERALGEASKTVGDEVVYPLTDAGDRCIVTYDGDRATQLKFQFT